MNRFLLKHIKRLSAFGFSLLEIMIAMGILATAVLTFMSQVEVSSQVAYEDEQLLRATVLAQNKLGEIEREIYFDMDRGKFPDEKEDSGVFEGENDLYRWSYELKKVELPLETMLQGGTETSRKIAKQKSDEVKKRFRELRFKIEWSDPDNPEDKREKEKQFEIVTHVINFK